VTEKAVSGSISVVGGGMSGRQSGVSEETCLACERRAGVRARIILHAARSRGKARKAKPRRGKVGRKVEA